MNVLVTGFDAFNSQSINPTEKIVSDLPKNIDNHTIYTLILPTVQYTSIELLMAEIETRSPDVVLMLGQAGGISNFHIERVAINVDDFRIPDNHGNQPIDTPIYSDGEAAYFSTLPIKTIVQTLNEVGYKSTVSNSAGTYVCNHLFYGCAYNINKLNKNIRYGFIHVPFETSQANDNQASLPLQTMVEAIVLCLQTILNTEKDIRISGGLEF